MTSPAEDSTTVVLNMKWCAVRSENLHWTLYAKDKHGAYQLVDVRAGPRRRIFEMMDEHAITPTPQALVELDKLPETAGFPMDPDELREQ